MPAGPGERACAGCGQAPLPAGGLGVLLGGGVRDVNASLLPPAFRGGWDEVRTGEAAARAVWAAQRQQAAGGAAAAAPDASAPGGAVDPVGRAWLAAEAATPPPPPFVLSGHAASLTPY